jgi:glycerol-3-phosphate acyltransferase PlsY
MAEHADSIMFLIALLGGYLIGSIPFGLLLTKAAGLGDIRKVGSVNIGATNVLRTGHKGAALATLLLDAGKGAIAVLVARIAVGEDAAQVAGGMAFLGHLFPVWLGFKGGKGVATFLGTLIAMAWPVGLAACATWAVTAAITRISSLSALVAAALSGLWCFVFSRGDLLMLTFALMVLVYIRHWPNLQRIKAGTEPKIGQKS